MVTKEATADFAGRGWAFPLTLRHDGTVATVGGPANVEKSMRIVLSTHLGERPMRPRFGSRLRDFLFEPVTEQNAAALGAEVRRALHACEPRVRVEDVVVRVAPGPAGRFDIDICYTLLATNDSHNLVVPFYAIPGEGD